MVQNLWNKITENLGFVETGNFIIGSTEAAVRGCSGKSWKEITHG